MAHPLTKEELVSRECSLKALTQGPFGIKFWTREADIHEDYPNLKPLLPARVKKVGEANVIISARGYELFKYFNFNKATILAQIPEEKLKGADCYFPKIDRVVMGGKIYELGKSNLAQLAMADTMPDFYFATVELYKSKNGVPEQVARQPYIDGDVKISPNEAVKACKNLPEPFDEFKTL